jgi:succinate-semialdehyde dehydrogenase/glutarate-semialdehyde dehydrogenase
MALDVRTTGLLVEGGWQIGAGRMRVVDKFTGEVAAELHVPGPEQVEQAIDSATRALTRPFPVPARAAVLRAAGARLAAEREAMVRDYVTETGFTPADAEVEIDRTLSIFELSAQEAERLVGELVPVAGVRGHEDSLCLTQRVPVGVVAAISPFNAPLSTVAHKVAPALAAGNAVVLKPAELTPLSSLHLGNALLEAGLPKGRLGLLVGPGRTVGEQVVRHPAVRYITFTGSTEVGRHIRAVSGLARTQLELGSNSPTIVWRDADLERALPLVVRAGYRKAGQVCTSVQRLIVHAELAEEVTGRLGTLVAALNFGDPRATGTSVGPVISAVSAERAMGLVQDALSCGARVVTGARRDGAVITPTLLDGLSPGARLAQEEAFAPIVAITKVDSLDEAVQVANSTAYGLQGGVFCQDLDVAFTFARRLDMGGVIINDTSSYHPDPMPYGGVKDSGHGIEGPRYAVHDMTDSRTVVLRLRPPS